jgi:hypothetical protein
MQKVDAVQSARVSLKDGLTILDLKPDNRVTLAQLRQIIKNNGFVSKEARVTARGVSSTAEGKPIFEVSGTRERFLLSASPQQSGDDWVFSVSVPSR